MFRSSPNVPQEYHKRTRRAQTTSLSNWGWALRIACCIIYTFRQTTPHIRRSLVSSISLTAPTNLTWTGQSLAMDESFPEISTKHTTVESPCSTLWCFLRSDLRYLITSRRKKAMYTHNVQRNRVLRCPDIRPREQIRYRPCLEFICGSQFRRLAAPEVDVHCKPARTSLACFYSLLLVLDRTIHEFLCVFRVRISTPSPSRFLQQSRDADFASVASMLCDFHQPLRVPVCCGGQKKMPCVFYVRRNACLNIEDPRTGKTPLPSPAAHKQDMGGGLFTYYRRIHLPCPVRPG